jgi:hypothetical protein
LSRTGCLQLQLFAELLQRDLAVATQDPAINYLFWSGPLSLGRRGLMAFRLSEEALRGCESHLDAMVNLAHEPVQGRIQRLGHLLLFLGLLARSLGTEHRRAIELLARVHAPLRNGSLLETIRAQWTCRNCVAPAPRQVPCALFKAGPVVADAYLARCRADAPPRFSCAAIWRSTMCAASGLADPNYFARRFKRTSA